MSTKIAQTDRDVEVTEHLRDDIDETLDAFELELSETFPVYRDRVETTAEQIPEWSAPTPSEIQSLFELDTDDLTDEQAWLGPQVVGVAAGRVDTFATDWLRPASTSNEPELAESNVEQFNRETRELQQWVARLEDAAHRELEDAHDWLDDRLESTLTSLEEEREERFETLQERVEEGDIEAGEDEQDERARIWEEQRRRAEAVRSHWRDLRALLDEGYTYAATHLEELAILLEEARDALHESHGELDASSIVDELHQRVERRQNERRRDVSEPTAQDTSSPPTPETDEGAGAEHAPQQRRERAESFNPGANFDPALSDDSEGVSPTQPALDDMDEKSSGGFARDPLAGTDEEPGTDPLASDFSDLDDDPLTAPEPDNDGELPTASPESGDALTSASDATPVGEAAPQTENVTDPEERPLADEPDRHDDPMEAPNETQPPESRLHGSAPSETAPREEELDETSSDGTRPMRAHAESSAASEMAPAEASDASNLPETRSDLSATSQTETDSESTPSLDDADASQSRRPSRSPSQPARSADSLDADPQMSIEPSEDRPPAENASPSEPEQRENPTLDFNSKCLRIQGIWQSVDFSAIALALGPPGAVLAGLFGMCLMHLAGLPGVVNPIEAWSWTQPVAAVAMIWCLCAPMIMGWRPRWRGWSFELIHEVEEREECDVELDAHQFRLGDRHLDWDDIRHVERQRWGEPDEDVFGWQVTITPRQSETIDMVAREFDVQAWQSSSTPITEPATDAWQVDPEVIEAIVERAPSGEPIETKMGASS